MESNLNTNTHVHPIVAWGKGTIDKVGACLGLVVFALLLPCLALAIKLESTGPVFYRQMRVGRSWSDFTEIFWILKLRTMRVDAESASGAVWAAAKDPRITRVGRILRKARLDELPQLVNVLYGEMSLIGPRPERPEFFKQLEAEMPFYTERVNGVAPGLTGMAQVALGYDENIEAVRKKLAYDHAYAIILTHPWKWLLTDISILLSTVKVVILGRGQ